MHKKSAEELKRRIQKRELGVAELTRHFLARIEKYDGPSGLNSVAQINEQALKQAKVLDERKDRSGLLFGLPILIKDNIDVEGLFTTAGSLALSDNLAVKDAPIVERLRKEGAIILGKTNMTELANYMAKNMPGGYSSRGGQVLHAYKRDKNPGGSSSGSGVAVSAGLCAAAIGTDTSFSIVGCANINGVVGIRPTHGVLPSEGIIPIASSLDTSGPMTRNVSDALLVYSAMRETFLKEIPALSVGSLRLGVNTFHRKRISEDLSKKMHDLLELLKSEGAMIQEIHQPHIVEEDVIMRYEFQRDLDAYLERSASKRKSLREIVEYNQKHSDTTLRYGDYYLHDALAASKQDQTPYVQAMELRKQLQLEVSHQLREFDAVLMTGRTALMHFVGLPSVALPLAMGKDGVPLGIILYGKDEEGLFSAARTIEKYSPGVLFPDL